MLNVLWCSKTFLQDKQLRRTTVFYANFSFYTSTTVCNQNINKQIHNTRRRNIYELQLSIGMNILTQKFIYKDDIEIVTQLSCLLSNSVFKWNFLASTLLRFKGFTKKVFNHYLNKLRVEKNGLGSFHFRVYVNLTELSEFQPE